MKWCSTKILWFVIIFSLKHFKTNPHFPFALPFAQPPTAPYRSLQCLRSTAAALVPPTTADEVFGIGKLIWNGDGDVSNPEICLSLIPTRGKMMRKPLFSLISWSSKILANWNPLKRVHDPIGKILVCEVPQVSYVKDCSPSEFKFWYSTISPKTGF